jgi:hypothetical protein
VIFLNPKESLVAIFKSIEVYYGMDLLLKKTNDGKSFTGYLLQLEEEGYITIDSKFFIDNDKMLYSSLSMTDRGEAMYKTLLCNLTGSV